MKILNVLIEYKVTSLNTPFSYVCDDNVNVEVGCRVYVPFGHQNIVGYVINIKHSPLSLQDLQIQDNCKYKYIYKVLDDHPILDEELVGLANHMSKEYVCPLISCLQTILPPTYKPSKTALKEITYKKLKKVFVSDDIDYSKLRKHQVELLERIKIENGIFLKDLPIAQVNTLRKHKLVYIEEIQVVDDYFKDYVQTNITHQLNEEQNKAFNEITSGTNDVYLLQGVTGSGKTEVYISLVEHYVNMGKTAIILVPEISLTPMIIQRFKNKFKDIAVLHGSLSAKEKQIQYDKIKNQEVKVVIGARSAVFAPLKDIGIIILDEEQSTSYKQDKSPTYHARDIAIYRAKQLKAKVVLGSATPSFESKARAMKGVYKIVYLRKRANQKDLPHVSVINMREEVSDFSPLISYTLDYEINRCLDNNEKIILLQNRRGYSPYVSCRACGYTFKCPHCELSLSYHKNGDKFKCHYCNFEFKFNHICPKCDGKDFLFMGSGTQKIEEIIEQRYPKAKLLRMDNDTTSIKNGHLKILEKFEHEDYNILLGTQMVAKGLDFHDVTLVGVINADISLSAADFRSAEYTYELLSQVAGRAGRGQKQGNVIVQSFNPEHYAIQMSSRHEYELFYQTDMLFRHKMNYPPFSYMSSITILCEKADQACIMADKIFEELKQYKDFELLGPALPYLYKENNKIRMKILIKSKKHDLINQALQNINNKFANEAKERKCSIVFDIDTYHLL